MTNSVAPVPELLDKLSTLMEGGCLIVCRRTPLLVRKGAIQLKHRRILALLSGERDCVYANGSQFVGTTLKPGDILVSEPNASLWCGDDQPCEVFSSVLFPDSVRFTAKTICGLGETTSVLYCGHAETKTVWPLLEYLELLDGNNRRPDFAAFRKLLLDELKAAAANPLPEQEGDGAAKLADELAFYVEEHLREAIDCKRLAKVFKINPNYVSQLFLRKRRQGIAEYVTELRLELATSLLEGFAMNVGEISDYCGFMRSNYFIKVFKRRYGMTPLQYRNRWRVQGYSVYGR